MTAAMREVAEPTVFFEALGVRYVGPIDGHDVAGLEDALRNAADFDGPIVVHVLTQKGRGYPPAEDDDEKCLHDARRLRSDDRPGRVEAARLHPGVLRRDRRARQRAHPQVIGITAAMPGPTGLLPFQDAVPRPLLRRRHRRAARRHDGGGHGDGRPASGRRAVLDVLHPRLRPGQPRRRPARPAGRVRARPRRHHRRRRPVAPRRARHGAVPDDSRA